MKQKNLWIMCGIPGSGKSTYCEKQLCPGVSRVSRDVIRFALVDEDEEYFSHEFDVFKEFIRQINQDINCEYITDIYVDATHLNEKSRNKLLDRLKIDDININIVNFLIDFDLAWERNCLREGRSVVPYASLQSMYNAYQPARFNEKYNYHMIIDIEVTKDGNKINGYING